VPKFRLFRRLGGWRPRRKRDAGKDKPRAARPRTVRLRTWLMPVLGAVVILMQVLEPYRGWRILIVGLAGVFVLSLFWALSLSRGVQLRRQMRFGWAQVGDRLVERFTFHNRGWAPAIWAEVLDHSTLPGYSVSRGTGVGGRDSIRWHTEAVCSRRGLFTLGPTSLSTGDPFGIFSVDLDFPASMPLLVLPPIVPLPSIQVAPGGRSGGARPRANILDRTVSAASVREYAPGDSRRWVHWRTTARRDELFVRLFDSTPAGDWWILLDMQADVQSGAGYNATDEHGVILAASLADRGIRLRRAVGLVAEGQELVWRTPGEGEGQRWEILRSLALINRGERPLAEMLARVGDSMGRNASLVIITPSTEMSWVEELVPLVRQGAVPTVLLLDPVSFATEVDAAAGLVPTMAGPKIALQNLGVSYYDITRDVLDLPEARPGHQGRWEWKVTGTGKAVAVRRGGEQAPVDWRTLA